MSQITTHILDTSLGAPARGVGVVLRERVADEWRDLARSITDDDGRASDLLAADRTLSAGAYQLEFHTGDYYRARNAPCFYPLVSITFDINGDGEHYHLPLLLNPFGYSTYRGS